MKLSNNALNFLLAQYRAIFKRAYVKGLAAAVILTAGLAAGAAQAHETALTNPTLLPGADGSLTFDGTGSATDNNKYTYLQITSGTGSLNGTIDITAGLVDGNSTSGNYIMGNGTEETSVTGSGTINIDVTGDAATNGLAIIAGAQDVNVDVGTINVIRGTLNIWTNSGTKSGTIAADNINIGADGATEREAFVTVTSNATSAISTTLGNSGSIIAVNQGGQLSLQSSGSGSAVVDGKSLTLNNGALMLTDSGTGNIVTTDDFIVGNGAFKVISGDGTSAVGETFQGHTATVQSGGNFLVGTSGTWTVGATSDKDTNGDPIKTHATFDRGSNVQVDGTIVVSGGLLTIAEGANLHATTAPSSNKAGTIVLAVGPDAGTVGEGLEIDSSVLKGFLKAEDAYNDITTYGSGNYIVDTETQNKDVAGSLILSGGRLTLSDTEQVELTDFRFVSGDGSSGTAGAIVVSGANRVINGNNVSVAYKLTDSGSGEGTPLANGASIYLSVSDLTLGNGQTGGLTQLSGSGLGKIKATNSLTVKVANDGYFKLNGAPESVSLTNSDTSWTSEVNGNIDFGTSSRTMIKGKWVFNDDINLSQAGGQPNLIIGPDITQNSIAYDTYVTFKGEILNNTDNGGFGSITASSNSVSDTIVDLTQATLASKSDQAGWITLAASKGSTIKITGNQFEQILTAQKGNSVLEAADGFSLNVGSGSFIEVTNAVTSEHNFNKFRADEEKTSGENFMFFASGGTLSVNGDLGLYTGDKNDNTKSGAALNIGQGTIEANQITLTNYHITDSKNKTYEAVTLQSGTLAVSQGLTVRNSDTLNVGSGASDVASIVLSADSVSGTGTLSVAKDINLNGNGAIEVKQGAWSTTANIYAKGSSGLVLSNDAVNNGTLELADGAYAATFTGKNFNATGTGTAIEANEGTKATFDTMQLADGSTVNLNDGHLLVNGANVTLGEGEKASDNPAYVNPDANKTSTTADIDFGAADINVTGSSAVMEFGELATSKLLTLNSDNKTIALTKGGIDDATFNVDDFGQLKFNFAENTQLNTDQISSLISATGVGDKNGSGYINLGNADLGFNFQEQENGTIHINWDDIEDFVNVIGSAATTDQLKQSLVTNIDYTDKVKGHYGALSVNTTTNTLTLNGPTSLHNAAAFGNNFVINQNTGAVVGLRLENGASVNLANGGNVGAIEGNFADSNEVFFSNDEGVDGPTTTTVSGDITKVNLVEVGSTNNVVVQGNVESENIDVAGSLSNLATANSSISTNDLNVTAQALVETNNLTLGHINGNAHTGYASVLGTVNVADTITLSDGDLAVYGGNVTTKNLTLDAGSSVRVGYEANSTITADDETTAYDETKSYTGVFEVTGTTSLNDGYLFVDPAYGDETALISLNGFKDADTNQNTNLGTMDGSAFVGANSALAVGSESAAFLQEKIARFQTNGSLRADEDDSVGAVMYVGNSFTLKSGHGIILTAQSLEDFIEYYNTNDGATADRFASNETEPKLVDTIYLGDKTVVMMDAGALTRANTNNGTVTPVISFGATTAGTIIADGGDILVDGQVRAGTYQLVEAGTNIDYIDGTDYAVVTDNTAAHFEDNINVATDNEFLTGVLGANGTVELGVDRDNARSIMYGASTPVVESLIAYAQGYNGVKDADISNGDDTDYLYDGYVQTGTDPNTGDPIYSKDTAYSNYFLDQVVSTGHGHDAETAARFGIYGGAPQAAIQAGKSSTDAIAQRFGIGSAVSNLTLAGNTQGAALWLAPVYKSADSDGFEAQGVDYGVNVDLYGVALGADYTLANGITFGAMFNLGSGEVDGEGAASATSNDFDYYGFAVYGGYTMGQFSVVGDVSYTSVDNDLEGSTSIDRIGASMDSTNLSIGVTGKYELSFNGVDITPHAGLRFSNIDLDDYTIDGNDVIASADSDDMSIFSIPVGVTVAKEFKGETWTVAPSFDLTLTGQFGDDELDGSVSWAGVSNLSTHTTTEVFDNFTYGATLGVEAQSVGGVALGISVGYTGSSNTDELGVNANARFVF